jgi:molybdate transport system substrate-binding protein
MLVKTKFYTSLFFILILILTGCKKQKEEKSILLYCAAGIKPALEKVAKSYYEEYGIRVDLQFGGSGTLLANIRIAQQGDLYVAADKSYVDEAIHYGLIDETQPLAKIKPVIAVQKGNPKGIKSVEDLKVASIKVAIANPEAASIGRLMKNILTKSNHWEAIKENATVFMPTVVEVANNIKLEAVDAGIVWDATANQYDDLEIVTIPEFDSHIKNITIGVLKFSKQPTEALKFLRYLAAKDKGLLVFDRLGYEAIEGDQWSETPELLFYSGGVNRAAVDNTVRKFEEREGVDVIRVYTGCGILVSQMKAGQEPDAYFSCDVSFMTQVEDRFSDITDISKTDIIIAVPKGNPLQIKILKDLSTADLKLGVCNHELSALGFLTKKLLESQNLWESVYSNVRVQTPTAYLLVNQLRTGSLDAVVVYEANVAQIKNKIDIVRLTQKEAMALQNFGVSLKSNNRYLTKRLLKTITDEKSKEVFLDNGFTWEFSKEQTLN